MDKEHLIFTLEGNVDCVGMIAEAMGYDPASNTDVASYMAGAADAYSIILESVKNGDFDVKGDGVRAPTPS